MKHINSYNDFLFEYKVSIEDIYQKYYKDIDYDKFLEIISSDPTTNIEKGLMGSYSKWLKIII